jgi:hypothetical protein
VGSADRSGGGYSSKLRFVIYHHQRRLDRALFHLEDLKAEVNTWLKERPHRTWTVTEDDVPKKYFYCQVLRKPHSHLSLIVGDCVHNLRSALDNLAFELALAHKRGALSKGIQRDSAFPILRQDIERDENSMKRFKTMTRGMCSDAKTVIEQLQPYKRGKITLMIPFGSLTSFLTRISIGYRPLLHWSTLRPLATLFPMVSKPRMSSRWLLLSKTVPQLPATPPWTKLAQEWRT